MLISTTEGITTQFNTVNTVISTSTSNNFPVMREVHVIGGEKVSFEYKFCVTVTDYAGSFIEVEKWRPNSTVVIKMNGVGQSVSGGTEGTYYEITDTAIVNASGVPTFTRRSATNDFIVLSVYPDFSPLDAESPTSNTMYWVADATKTEFHIHGHAGRIVKWVGTITIQVTC